MSSKIAQHMTWHTSNICVDGFMAHPCDSEVWKYFDRIHSDFASDLRNVHLELRTYGFNPVGYSSIFYSYWPVLIMVYNLSPWMCLKW